MQTINFGVIGCGIISRSHFASIRDIEGTKAVAAADVNPETLNARCDEFDVPRRYSGWKELLQDEEVQAVSICLPHSLHLAAALDAIRAGKHILIEKPMANTLGECDQITAAAAEKGVTVMVAQVLRRYPSSKLAKQLIREGRIGRVASIQRRRMGDCSGNLQSYSWATKPEIAGGWLLYSFGPHEYDTILWLLDTEVESLAAVGVCNRPVWNDYDEITSIMRLKNGAMATMIQSLNSAVSAWDCVIVGESGTIYLGCNEVQLNGESVEVAPAGAEAFREQVQEFVDSLREGREPDVSGRRVRPTMQALEMVKASLQQGATVYSKDF